MKCKITFEDNLNGTVKIVFDPSAETMTKMNQAHHKWTPAEEMHLMALNYIWKHLCPKEETPSNLIL